MNRLSACVIVFQEQANLRECLESIAGTVDEIIVVHDGPCVDDSLKIARAFTSKVFETEARAGSSEFIRPFALRQCTGDWVLVLDADERLSPPLRAAIRKLIENPEADAYGFQWPYVDRDGGRIAARNMAGKRFLFRRALMYTIGLPHMTPDTYGTCQRSSLAVHHLQSRTGRRAALRGLWHKNRRRGHAAAARLLRGKDAVDVYNATLDDPRVKNVRKLDLICRHPRVALVAVPAWGFFYWYFVNGYIRAGWSGFLDALNLPMYYAAFAWSFISQRKLAASE